MPLATLISSTLEKWTGVNPRPDSSRNSRFPDISEAPPDSRRLISDRRYCQVLATAEFDDISIECAWQGLQHDMAFVPGGAVCIQEDMVVKDGYGYELTAYSSDPIAVSPFYLDRECISNADYFRFVRAGCYDQVDLWPADILPMLLQFTDSTGNPGPRFWSDGRPNDETMDHPVVGISWYEASAYASWSGKRLPTSAEWQRAGTWPKASGDTSAEQRYPWGNAFDPAKANLWKSNASTTLPVDALAESQTPNCVRQLIGNVWEWIDAQYIPACTGDVQIVLDDLMAEVRGAAFDTYFPSQATCQFRSGQPVFHRATNVGFRCCVNADHLHPRQPQSEEE